MYRYTFLILNEHFFIFIISCFVCFLLGTDTDRTVHIVWYRSKRVAHMRVTKVLHGEGAV